MLRSFYESGGGEAGGEMNLELGFTETAIASSSSSSRQGYNFDERAGLLLAGYRSLGDTDCAKGAKRPNSLLETANESMFEGEWIRALGCELK